MGVGVGQEHLPGSRVSRALGPSRGWKVWGEGEPRSGLQTDFGKRVVGKRRPLVANEEPAGKFLGCGHLRGAWFRDPRPGRAKSSMTP